MHEFYFYKIIDMYNDLKNELKALAPNKFKIQLRKFLNHDGISPCCGALSKQSQFLRLLLSKPEISPIHSPGTG